MKRLNFKKKYVAGALAAGLIMGAGGLAAAYFTATGTGTGKASVGHATPFAVTQNPLSGDLYPGQTQAVSFNIHNVGHGIQHYSITTTDITVATTAGNIVTASTTAGVTGCKASWFTTHTASGLTSGTLGPNDSTTLAVTVDMSNGTGAGSTQNACQTKFPKLAVSFGTGLASAAAFDGTYSGTTYKFTNLTAPSLAVSPSSLGSGGHATFTVTVQSTPNAAKWNTTTAELIMAGFDQPGAIKTLSGDGSLIFAQDNSMGTGYCANTKFFTTGGTFVFGTGDACYVHSGTLGSTETYSVTITGTNTYSDTVSFTSATTHPGFTCSAGTCSKTFNGTLSLAATTVYVPALHLLPGRTSTTPTATYTYTVTGGAYSKS